ncbi:hypothetical protein M9H77_35751 [Catharanthus roseus]|uniref:Uncharacterized protein n=1 Tax=Catharanthus roseus TaxID=4058 RepID=A0ACB9ZPX2_CATRO|nr:hypothetical protein M9H77_35751 [Catharanthus roseus]
MHNNQWAYGNFSPHVRSYDHNSYGCYEGDRLRSRNYYNDRSYERAPRNEVRNGGNNVKIDERVHKRRGDVERYHDSYDHYENSYGRVEDKGRSMEKELGTILDDLSISLYLNPFIICHEVSFVELKLFLGSCLSHVSILGDICAISFGGGLFLLMSSMSKCLSFSCLFYEQYVVSLYPVRTLPPAVGFKSSSMFDFEVSRSSKLVSLAFSTCIMDNRNVLVLL